MTNPDIAPTEYDRYVYRVFMNTTGGNLSEERLSSRPPSKDFYFYLAGAAILL